MSPITRTTLAGPCCRRRLAAAGLIARENAEDLHRCGVQVESDAVAADAESILWRVNVREPLGVAGASGGEAFDALLDAAGNAFVERGHIGKGRFGPLDLPRPFSELAEPESPHGFGVGNALAAVVLQPVAGFVGG